MLWTEARSEADDEYVDLRAQLQVELELADKHRLKILRDNIVHGYTWDFDMPAVVVGRFARKSDGSTIVMRFDELEAVGWKLYIYGLRLDRLVHGLWAEATLDPHDEQILTDVREWGYLLPPDDSDQISSVALEKGKALIWTGGEDDDPRTAPH